LDQSLERTNIEHVDIFYSHRPDPKTPIEETMSALDYAVRSGKALYAGIPSYHAKQTEVSANALRRLGTRRVGPGSRTPSRSQIPDVHIRVRFTRLRHHERIIPEPEIVHAVRTFGHRKERFPIRSFHARKHQILPFVLHRAGVEKNQVNSTDTLNFNSSGALAGNTGAKSSQSYNSINTRGRRYSCSLASENNVLISFTEGCTDK
jgi:hypothetical protein